MTAPDVRVTADANMLASGVVGLRSRPDAAPVRLVRAWQTGQFTLIQSDPLLAEVDRTLAKPYFTHRLPATERQAFLDLLRRRAVFTPLTATVTGIATHPEDDMVLATALSGNAQFVVTGDHKLIRLKSYEGLILVSVHEFLATLPGLSTARGDAL